MLTLNFVNINNIIKQEKDLLPLETFKVMVLALRYYESWLL